MWSRRPTGAPALNATTTLGLPDAGASCDISGGTSRRLPQRYASSDNVSSSSSPTAPARTPLPSKATGI
ncbi:hypothetical protein E2C01_007946 [Portunus trituberculatus]|uniref:Uncharacterized protein n=1 Tax=Portunus trituberculatus TaxID=210409 RepID=A0A5B7CZH3_PORTR|nr:hypothetical protein [Portunus trituberculatus]